MAALAHAGIILPFTGILAPIVIWVTQKGKSSYVAFQAIQALAYHLLLFIGGILGFACYLASFFLMFGGIFYTSSKENVPPLIGMFGLLPFGVMGLLFCGGFLFILYGLVAAVLALSGKEFRYFLLGDFIERRMEQV